LSRKFAQKNASIFLMAPSELVTAAQEGLAITVVIPENRGYQVIHRLQMGRSGHEFGNEFRHRDLSHDLGVHGDLQAPWYLESLAAVRAAAARARQGLRSAGRRREAAAAKRAEAWTLVAVGSDASLLAASLAAELLRQQLWLLCWQLAGDVGARKAHTLSSASAAGASCRTRFSDSDQTVPTRRWSPCSLGGGWSSPNSSRDRSRSNSRYSSKRSLVSSR
jgi:Thiamine pyrophosphate enzyme, C-terminal TPP binding domain